MAWMTSSVKSLGCGEIKLIFSMPSIFARLYNSLANELIELVQVPC